MRHERGTSQLELLTKDKEGGQRVAVTTESHAKTMGVAKGGCQRPTKDQLRSLMRGRLQDTHTIMPIMISANPAVLGLAGGETGTVFSHFLPISILPFPHYYCPNPLHAINQNQSRTCRQCQCQCQCRWLCILLHRSISIREIAN